MEIIPKSNSKSVLSLASLITVFVVSYYLLGSYKYFLEIKKIKENNGTQG